jgi:hypothetical protein
MVSILQEIFFNKQRISKLRRVKGVDPGGINMPNLKNKQIIGTFVITAALAISFMAGTAFGEAKTARLDNAKLHLQKAIALLKAADNPEVKPPFGGHRNKALNAANKALQETERARSYQLTHTAPKKRPKIGKKQ